LSVTAAVGAWSRLPSTLRSPAGTRHRHPHRRRQ